MNREHTAGATQLLVRHSHCRNLRQRIAHPARLKLVAVRVDAWVWAVRLAKTRSQATAACKAGHVRVNDAPAKPSQAVKIGDVVRIRLHGFEKIYRVTNLATRRGSATVAATLFEDLTPPAPPKVERPMDVVRDRGAGRPTKRDRRDIDRLRGRDSLHSFGDAPKASLTDSELQFEAEFEAEFEADD